MVSFSKESLEILRRLKQAAQRKKCSDVTVGQEECVTVGKEEECVTECDEVTNQQCRTFPRQESRDEPKLQCHLMPDGRRSIVTSQPASSQAGQFK